MKQDIPKYVGKMIRKYRKANNMTQKELGLKIGVKHNTISSYENGTNEVEQNMLFRLANALNISINDLFPQKEELEEQNDIDTIAAHHDREEWTEEELEEIEKFKEFVRMKRKNLE